MAPLRQRPPSYMKELTGNLLQRLGADLLTQIQIPLHSDEPDVAQQELAEMLAVAADEEPELLDQLVRTSSDGSTARATTSPPQQDSA